MLFVGPPGSGKTTTAQSFAMAIHGKTTNSFSSLLFLNSSDERSLDMIRSIGATSDTQIIDVGGGASIMGTLSGGERQRLVIAREILQLT